MKIHSISTVYRDPYSYWPSLAPKSIVKGGMEFTPIRE